MAEIGEVVATVVKVRPFGPGGAEMDMTRAEMLEHIGQLTNQIAASTEILITLLFGWLISTYLVAHKLSRVQFSISAVLYSIWCWLTWSNIQINKDVREVWGRYAGMKPLTDEDASAFSELLIFLTSYVDPFFVLAALMYFASMYFAFISRRTGIRRAESEHLQIP